MRNLYFSAGARSEQNLYEDLIIEAIKIYGQDLYYLPRDLVNVDDVFREDPVSSFNSNYLLEMYVDNTDGFSAAGPPPGGRGRRGAGSNRKKNLTGRAVDDRKNLRLVTYMCITRD